MNNRFLGAMICGLSMALLTPVFSGDVFVGVSVPVLLQSIGGILAIVGGCLLLRDAFRQPSKAT